MLRKIFYFGILLPYTGYNMYKIMQLVWTHRMCVISFLMTGCLIDKSKDVEIN
jgi:hypothetical protein